MTAHDEPFGVLIEDVPFTARLRATVERGILHGVYAAIVLLLVGLALVWMAGDYSVTKARAENGQRAWEVIQRAQQQQQKGEAK